MIHMWRWMALWALTLITTLAPSHADGNIGCLYSPTVCIKGAEWCFDDYAFGKCIPVYDEELDDNSLMRYEMTESQLQWFENVLQRLVARGYQWDNAYTQCLLQAMLYSVKQELEINEDICDYFSDPKLDLNAPEASFVDITPDETAFIRYTPNSNLQESEFGNEIYNPPDASSLTHSTTLHLNKESDVPQASVDELRNIILSNENTKAPGIVPFPGFRERINSEKIPMKPNVPEALMVDKDKPNVPEALMVDKDKKSIPPKELSDDEKINKLIDEERIGAHYRKIKEKYPPFTAEYITQNRFSPLDEEFRTNALEKYKQSFAEKNFPFEYENPENEIHEPRVYIDDDIETPYDGGSGEIEAIYAKGEGLYPKNMQDLLIFWNSIKSKLEPSENYYAEGGPMKADDFKNDKNKYYTEDLKGFVVDEFGFKRRERVDVKKPGPFIDAQHLKVQGIVTEINSPKGGQGDKSTKEKVKGVNFDNTVTYVTFKNKYNSEKDTGLKLMKKIEQLLGLKENTFTKPRIDANEISFKVESNNKGLDAKAVAQKIDEMRNVLQDHTGTWIVATGIGDKVKRPVAVHSEFQEIQYLGIDLPILLALFGSLAILIIGGFAFFLLLKKDMKTKKMQGLSTAAEIDAEATRDYQDLCRARMSGGKWSGQQTAAASHPTEQSQRIASLTKESEKSPSARSSTSSWTEEPALTNMDISTGHMVLAYMEDHLRNKDRLEQEWQALCAYEAEPSAATAALRPENNGKNRYTDVLPYDHSRVTLNSLSNHLGSDYINASTITDHDPRNPAYIAAAGPLAHTAADFWQMIWEQGAVVMVMLTRLTENDRQLCHRYWPDEGSDIYHIYEVHLVSEHIWCDDYLVRSFYLKNQRTGETRTVTQFHFLSWPENGVPSSTKALLEFRRKVNKSYRGRSCPIVVHCRYELLPKGVRDPFDGAGRTGTYCLIDMVLNRMAKGAKEIDIAATLEHIRDQRPCTVATKQQFEFVLMAVAEEVHAILKALPAHLQQLQDKKEKEKEDVEKEK